MQELESISKKNLGELTRSGGGGTDWGGLISSFLDSGSKIAQTAIAAKQQKTVLDYQRQQQQQALQLDSNRQFAMNQAYQNSNLRNQQQSTTNNYVVPIMLTFGTLVVGGVVIYLVTSNNKK